MGNNYQHPDYYNRGRTEVWDIAVEHDLNFLKGNVLKYLLRGGHKDGADEIADLLKARNYLDKQLEVLGYTEPEVGCFGTITTGEVTNVESVTTVSETEGWCGDGWEPIWSVSDDGVTTRYGISGGMNDIELWKHKATGEYSLWIETIYSFENGEEGAADYLRHLRDLFRWYLEDVYEMHLDYCNLTYEDIFYDPRLQSTSLSALYAKFDFFVSSYCDRVAVVTEDAV